MNAPILGPPPRGVTQSDVSHAADSLLRAGERPTIDKVRAKIGKGSPNTINPLLDAWWKTLAARLDSGPAALHRLPEPIAHIAEALWIQALEEGKRRAAIEQRDNTRLTELDKQRLELRSHVLTLREGELDSRLHERDRTIEDLNQRLRELTMLLKKQQVTADAQTAQISSLGDRILARHQPQTRAARARTPPGKKRKKAIRRAAPLRTSTKPLKNRKNSAARKR
jgi:uncharacterized coiled-coil protein SlyX